MWNHWVGATKSKCKAIKSGTTPLALKQKKKWNSKINDHINKSLYNFIMHHPQVVQSPIVNNLPKVNTDGHTDRNLFQNGYCRSPFENFITYLLVTQKIVDPKRQNMQKIISLSVILHYVHYWHPNLKKGHQDTKSCVVLSVVYLPKVYIHHYYHVVIVV